jgi:hypothetical protein
MLLADGEGGGGPLVERPLATRQAGSPRSAVRSAGGRALLSSVGAIVSGDQGVRGPASPRTISSDELLAREELRLRSVSLDVIGFFPLF